MKDGYYWYLRGEGDERELDTEEPKVVEVWQGAIFVCGSDVLVSLGEAHGRFIGPLEPPSEQTPERIVPRGEER